MHACAGVLAVVRADNTVSLGVADLTPEKDEQFPCRPREYYKKLKIDSIEMIYCCYTASVGVFFALFDA